MSPRFRRTRRPPISSGRPTTNVVFDFTGTNWSTTASRKIALKGTVSHVRASSGHLRLLGGVSADEEGEKTLVLDGISEDAAIGNISDGAGRVSVMKDGPGTWRLMRNLTFGGRLDVRQGTLIVSNAKELHRWYRLKILKGNYVHNSLTLFDRCDEWALYDTEGKRCNLNLEFVKPSDFPSSGSDNIANDKDFHALQPGQVCWGNTGKWMNYAAYSIDMLFDGKTDTYFKSYGAHSNSNPEETALPIVLRLPEEAGEVTAVDLLSNTYNEGVAQFAVDGSPDGENWYKLTEVTCQAAGGDWYSDGTDYSADHVPDVVAHPEYKLESGIKNDYSVLSNVTAVSVSAGATLKAEGDVTLPALSVDCRGGGTIDGFALASSGTIEVSNAPSTTVELPVSFVNCSGLENVSQWTLSVVGRPNYNRRIVCRDGKLYLESPGFTVIVR